MFLGEHSKTGIEKGKLRRDSKKSQIFMFAIVGIIIFVVFVILLTLSYSHYKTNLRSGILSSSYQKNLFFIDTQMRNCLKNSAERSLKLVGEQGGYIFKSQGGATPNDFSINGIRVVDHPVKIRGSHFNMSYWILASSIDIPPAYPRYGSCGYLYYPLLEESGINFANLNLSRPVIKRDIESFVLHDFENCFDLEGLNKNFEGEVSLIGVPYANVSFDKKKVRFQIYYPVRFFNKVTYGKSYDVKLDFRRIYDVALRAVFSDVKDPYFDISNTPKKYAYPSNILVEKVIDGNLYDIIAVKDYSFTWDDRKPYTFYFMRQNRPPVLKDLSERNANGEYCYQREDNPIGYSPEICHNSTQIIDFTNCSADPDEDSIFTLIINPDSVTQKNIFRPNATFIGEDIVYNVSVYDSSFKSDWQTVKITIECCGDCCDSEYKGKNFCDVCKTENLYDIHGSTAGQKTYYCSPNLICEYNTPDVKSCH